MKKSTKILAGILSLAVMGASVGALAGCGGGKTTIKVSGSTSVNEIMEELAKEYEQDHNVRIQINANGSGVGIEDTIAGRNEIGMSSRDLKDDEKKKGIQGKQLCLDGIVLAVAKDCAATKVTNEQMWALAMDGTAFEDNGKTITALAGREASSGTREAFDEKIKDANGKSIKDWGKDETSPKQYSSAVTPNNSTGAVISKITSDADKKTVGYISMGSYLANTATLKALEFKAQGDSTFVAPSVETVKDGSYKMQRPFVIVTKTESTMSTEAKAFYDWLWSNEAKEIIESKGYVIK